MFRVSVKSNVFKNMKCYIKTAESGKFVPFQVEVLGEKRSNAEGKGFCSTFSVGMEKYEFSRI